MARELMKHDEGEKERGKIDGARPIEIHPFLDAQAHSRTYNHCSYPVR